MINKEIKMHYASPGLYERIVQGLEAFGKSPASVDLDDLAALDEFQLRGPAATRELIEILDVGEDSQKRTPNNQPYPQTCWLSLRHYAVD